VLTIGNIVLQKVNVAPNAPLRSGISNTAPCRRIGTVSVFDVLSGTDCGGGLETS
jgi:hypothetical protein